MKMQCSTFSEDDPLSRAGKEIHLINKVDLLDRHALFFDFDGTLVELGMHPDQIKVPPRRIVQLRHVFEKIRSMAIVSGRSLDELDHFLRPLVLPTAGVHGAEIRFNNRVKLLTSNTLPKPLAEAVLRLGCEHPDIYLEKKGERAIAVHYRQAPEKGLLIRELIDQLIQGYSGVEVIPGKYVFEVIPADIFKGNAVRAFMQMPPFRERSPVYFGDDATDESAFEVVNEMGGMSFKIGSGSTCANYRLASVTHVDQWLEILFASINPIRGVD